MFNTSRCRGGLASVQRYRHLVQCIVGLAVELPDFTRLVKINQLKLCGSTNWSALRQKHDLLYIPSAFPSLIPLRLGALFVLERQSRDQKKLFLLSAH